MGSRAVFESNDVGGARSVDAHGGGDLVSAGHAGELVAGPYAEDGAHREVGVDDAGAVEGIEGHTEPTWVPQVAIRFD